MELAVKTLDGKAAGKATVDEAVFGLEDIRGDLLQRTVRWQLAKRQAGTHKTQERGEVSVTTKKYIRQKGSGGARHGSRNANIFVGVAVAHGPCRGQQVFPTCLCRDRCPAWSAPASLSGLTRALATGRILCLEQCSKCSTLG